jgi:hypothetical protein
MGFPLSKGCNSLFREERFRPLTDPCEEFLTNFSAWDSRPLVDFHWSNYRPEVEPDGVGEMSLSWSNLSPVYGGFKAEHGSPFEVTIVFSSYMGGRRAMCWRVSLFTGQKTRMDQIGVAGHIPNPHKQQFYKELEGYLRMFTENAG